MRYLVHVDFIDQRTFNQAKENGFDPEEWEGRNVPCQVLIDGKPFKETLKTIINTGDMELTIENNKVTKVEFKK